jgi:hypothetical protein
MKKIICFLCLLVLSLAGCSSDGTGEPVTVIDFSSMSKEEIQAWGEENDITIKIEQDYSDEVADGGFISQSKDPEDEIRGGGTILIVYSMGKEPSKEYQNALKKAESYSRIFNMSKAGLYNQLTSEYGDQFPADAAQWAIDHLEVDYKENALKSAENYSKTLHMSKRGIYDQLVSEYGEKFTPEEAQYAVDNLNVDYNKNALEKAKTYQEYMSMSEADIYDQLISDYGEKFTPEEAQYAIDHLND